MFVCEQQSSCWQRGLSKAAGWRQQQGQSCPTALPRQLCQSHLRWPWGLQGLSSAICGLPITSFPCSIIFWRALVYTQCCGTILIQWWWVFIQKCNIGDSFWVLNNPYHHQSSIKKGLWYRLWPIFDICFCRMTFSFAWSFTLLIPNILKALPQRRK